MTPPGRDRGPRPGQLALAVFDAFVFVDWYGTLSTAQFWDSIVLNTRHPLASRLSNALGELFQTRKDYVRSWMRGEVTDAEVVASLQLRLPANYRNDYLARELLRDCRAAQIDPDLAALVAGLRAHAFIGVASDNMDCFVQATPHALTGDLAIDELLVSSQIGHLKADDPDGFFGPTLRRYGLGPHQAVLIDDCPTTCERFEHWGGTAFHYTDAPTLRSELPRRWPSPRPGPTTGRPTVH